MWRKLFVFLTITTSLVVYIFFKSKNSQVFISIPPQAYPTTHIENTPKKFLIKTIFVPQAPEKKWDQPWQDACEEAALLTGVYFLKNQSPDINQIKNDILTLIDYQAQLRWPKDINISQMSQIATDYFQIETHMVINPTADQIKLYISQNKPILVPANGKILFRENKYFKNGGPYYHNLIVLGYNDTKKEFIVHDVGTQHGAYFTYSYQTLMKSIHDFPPSGHKYDINLGQPAILVFDSV